ncbi:unnamed protein product [Fraxinus pennsylvanica]|uniref:Uncharacterized protein n=1 Tax=Fraxinus pennsylvanica TaxID=56036 RepID=A0AAD2E0V3_9LAMI|nr:unnamed protein product [Fraxinus pennsylvanica]
MKLMYAFQPESLTRILGCRRCSLKGSSLCWRSNRGRKWCYCWYVEGGGVIELEAVGREIGCNAGVAKERRESNGEALNKWGDGGDWVSTTTVVKRTGLEAKALYWGRGSRRSGGGMKVESGWLRVIYVGGKWRS